MSEPLWGLWGGMPPGGWAAFGRAVDKESPFTLWYAGTREEAEAGKLAFEREAERYLATYGRARNEDDPYEYTVVPFDAEREPESRDAKPTAAQWYLLAFLRKYGTLNMVGLPPTYKQTLDVLHSNGWCRNVFTPEGREARYKFYPLKPSMILTAAGERAYQWPDAEKRAEWSKRYAHLGNESL